MKKSSYFFVILLVASFAPLRTNAQSSDITCKHYNTQNGLSSNIIEYVYVDREGYTWFASANGLQQFDGYNLTSYNYNADDTSSISYNFISSISEDRSGNIWINTIGRGINILDKKKRIFYHIYNDASHPMVLTSNNLPRNQEVFAPDDTGNMWVNTDNGLNKIRISDFNVEHYFGDFAGEILYDKSEKILWIASNVLKKFNPATKQLDFYQIYLRGVNNPVRVNSFTMDDKGLIWMGTSKGLFIFDKIINRFYTLPEYFRGTGEREREYKWSFEPIECVYSDYQGFIWIAIDKRIVRFDKNKGSFEVFTHEIDNPRSLQDAKISGIYGNNPRTLWIAYASGGVSKMNITLKAFRNYKSVTGDLNTLSANTVRSVYQDSRMNLWVGNYSDGLNRVLSNDPLKIIHYKCDPLNEGTLSSNYVTSIYVDRKERLWVGTFDKGFCFADQIYKGTHLRFTRLMYDQNLEVQDFAEDSGGNIWIGTQNGFYIYDYASKELIHYGDLKNQLYDLQQFNIQSVIFEQPNTFWITSWNRGISRLQINSDSRLTGRVGMDSIVIYEGIKDINHSNIDNCFITLCKDDNIFWLGSNVNGLVKMILRKGGADFVKYDQSKGAPGNSVYGIVKGRNGKIWISTNHGIGKFDPVTEKFFNYYEGDGLLSNAFVWNSYFQSNDGTVFFGGVNGLITFNPGQLTEDTTRNKVSISKLIVQNREIQIGDKIDGRRLLKRNIQYTDSITLTYKEPAFTVEFVALNAIDPEEINYAYRLEGFDKDWITSTSQKRYVTYTNLNQGNYTFLVRASNNITDSNTSATFLHIKILPPWWKTPYALTGFSCLFIFLLFSFRALILMRVRLVHEAKLEHLEREKTEEVYQFKMRFFTDISHEFRTPLSLILAPLQKIVSKAEHDPQLIKQSHLIRKNADRLLKLIDEVMDMRKIDLNKMKLSLVKGDIVENVRELTLSFEEIALQRSMILEFTSSVDSLITWFDENKLEKIVCNLLSNSFKYTPDKGSIKVSLNLAENVEPGKTEHSGDQQKYLEIRIRDNGIGIPAKYKNHLFERFFIIERFDSIIRRGTGIGLALTKELIDLHKGKISVDSEENKGSCFIINLPLITDPEALGNSVEILPDSQDSGDQIKRLNFREDHEYIYKYSASKSDVVKDKNLPLILLVEDDQEVRNFIKENFSSKYQFYEAADGRKGLDIACRIDPDVIICDIIMPVMDGIEMCLKIKSDLQTSHIPVIMLTARTSVENKIEGLEHGADAYIEKPFSFDLLEVQINNILENRRRLRNKFSKELILKPSEIAITSVDALFLQKAIDIVGKNISDPDFGSDEFCKEIGMSRSVLHRKLKGLAGQPASEFIRTLRLKRAVDLLEKSQLSVEEISYKVGFRSPAYFSKSFKTLFGKPPSEFFAK